MKLIIIFISALVLLCEVCMFSLGIVYATITQDALYPNQILYKNQMLSSSNHDFVLVMQADGNLVEQDMRYVPKPIWQSGTWGFPNSYLVNQDDGNLILYSARGRILWSSETKGHPGAVLKIQNDANLIVFAGNDDDALWSKTRPR